MYLRLWGWGRLLYSFTSNRQNQTDIRPRCWAWPRAGGQEKGQNRDAPFFGGRLGCLCRVQEKGRSGSTSSADPPLSAESCSPVWVAHSHLQCHPGPAKKGTTDRSGVSTLWTDLDTWIFTTPPLYLWGPSQVGVLVRELKWALLAARFPPPARLPW